MKGQKKNLHSVVVSKIESTVSEEDLRHALDCGMIGPEIDDDDDRCLSLVYSLL